jgi:hypothetical protein
MTQERALAVARAFDSSPHLRPLRVGGDPARIRVDPSLESVVAQHQPIDWLTVRRDERGGAFEGGRLQLLPGRGAWRGRHEDGEWRYSLTGHSIEQTWLADTVAEPGAVAAVANLFEELVVAADAAWGCVLPWAWWPSPLYTYASAQLPGVFWLNYFGPAFVHAHPELADVTGARVLETGGVLVRTTDEPWQPYEDDAPAWQAEVRTVLGDKAFEWQADNPALPSVGEHVAASPGTREMPWVASLARKAAVDRTRKHAAALKRLAKVREVRDEPALAEDSVEWSTSLDLDDWNGFAQRLTRRLRGELATALGRAVIAVVATAPAGTGGSINLDTQVGVISLGWSIDDEETVDLCVRGVRQVGELCDEGCG